MMFLNKQLYRVPILNSNDVFVRQPMVRHNFEVVKGQVCGFYICDYMRNHTYVVGKCLNIIYCPKIHGSK